MKKNMGNIDKVLRIITAVVMLSLYFMNIVEGTLGIVLVVLSIVFVVTSLINFCPLYTLCGMNTCKISKD